MSDNPRNYDRKYERSLSGSVQVRVRLGTEKGSVTRFVVQLEYRTENEWQEVVRYDHDQHGADEMAHDVTREGLHMDVFRDGKKHRTEEIAGPLPAGKALDLAEDHLAQNLQRFIHRFEQWHGI